MFLIMEKSRSSQITILILRLVIVWSDILMTVSMYIICTGKEK